MSRMRPCENATWCRDRGGSGRVMRVSTRNHAGRMTLGPTCISLSDHWMGMSGAVPEQGGSALSSVWAVDRAGRSKPPVVIWWSERSRELR